MNRMILTWAPARMACTTYWSEEFWDKSATDAGENQMPGFYFNVAFRCPNGNTE